MKIYFKPEVQIIARPQLITHEINRFLEDQNTPQPSGWVQEDETLPGDGESLPEFAGRMCYVSFGAKQGRRTNKEYLQNIIEMGHGSVLEHSNWTFLVSHCSRGLTHELVRHRSGFAYSQESTHYIDYTPENFGLCLDPRLEKFPAHLALAADQARQAVAAYRIIYDQLKETGVKKKEACSIARQLLPTGIESKIIFTANARALRHLIEYRGNSNNVLEIRLMALDILKLMKNEAPNIFRDINVQINQADGFEEAVSAHRKV